MTKKNETKIEVEKTKEETSKTTKAEKKACEYKKKACKLTNLYCPKIKKFIKENYKSTKFIGTIFVLVFAAFLLNFKYESNAKLHFSKLGVVKEVKKNGKSFYYLCQNDSSKFDLKSKKIYITCDTQVIEN